LSIALLAKAVHHPMHRPHDMLGSRCDGRTPAIGTAPPPMSTRRPYLSACRRYQVSVPAAQHEIEPSIGGSWCGKLPTLARYAVVVRLLHEVATRRDLDGRVERMSVSTKPASRARLACRITGFVAVAPWHVDSSRACGNAGSIPPVGSAEPRAWGRLHTAAGPLPGLAETGVALHRAVWVDMQAPS
jgi:hypothetical protein